MARVVKDKNGQYVAIKDDGSRIPLNPSKVAGASRLRDGEGEAEPEIDPARAAAIEKIVSGVRGMSADALNPGASLPPEPETKEEKADDEGAFQDWYKSQAAKTGINPNPDDPKHFYDYRAAFKADAAPDASGHWPSKFKQEGHPNMVIDGIDTRTGEPVDPMIVRNVQGVDVGTRALVKNWAATPEVAKRTLEEMGYDVKPWGNHPMKMQFAVRPRGKTGVWKVVDPDGFDWQDLLDLGGDLLSGTFQAGAMALAAPVAAAAGIPSAGAGALAVEGVASAVGSGAGEAARQGVGSLLGIKQNTSGAGIATAAAIGGAVPVAAKLAAPVIKPIGSALAYGFDRIGTSLRYAAARFAGVKDLPNMSLGAALDIITNRAGRKVVPIAEQAKALQRVMMDPKAGLLNETWPEVEKVNAALVGAKIQGAVMDMRPVLDDLERIAGSEGQGMAERRAAPREATDKFDALFKGVRNDPEFRPSAADATENPNLAKAVQERDRGFGLEPEPNRRAAERRTKQVRFADLPEERKAALVHEANMGEARAQAERRQDMGTAVFDFLHPEAKARLESAAKTIPMPAAAAPAAAKPLVKPSAQKQTVELLNFLVGRLQQEGIPLHSVPLDFAHQLKRYVQDIARRGGAYAGEQVEEPFAAIGRDAAAGIRQRVIDGMPDDLRDEFSNAMAAFERKAKLRNAIVGSFRTASDVESFLRQIHVQSNAAAALHLAGIEQEFGISLRPDLDLARASEMVAKGGPYDIVRKHPYAVGAAVFHPASAAVVGGVAGAPLAGKALQGAGRAVRGGTKIAAAAAERFANSEAAKATAVRMLQDAAAANGKGIASESQASTSRPRKRVTRLF